MNLFWRCILLAAFLALPSFYGQAQTPPTGRASELTSATARESYRAQFRYLKTVVHGIDLKGGPIVTDGVTTNIAEAEWPFLTVIYYGYACANIAMYDEALRADAISEMRWALTALQTPRLSGFMNAHFGPPFGEARLTPSVFVHGHFLSLAIRYREVTGDPRFDPLMQRIAEALGDAFAKEKQGILLSYKNPPMWWLTDNFPAHSALVRYDRIFRTHYSAGKDRCVAALKAYYLDPQTRMFCTFADLPAQKPGQGPRGISMMYGLHFLRDFAPDFAQEQYTLAKQYLVGSLFGCCAVREFPPGQEGNADIDSGQLIMGFGPSASGFAIGAAAMMDEGGLLSITSGAVSISFPDSPSGISPTKLNISGHASKSPWKMADRFTFRFREICSDPPVLRWSPGRSSSGVKGGHKISARSALGANFF